VLLVDRGYLGEDLEAGCRELRRAGFAAIGIVEGGLNAWAQTMGDLEGDRQTRGALNRIPARDFARATRYEHWLVVDVTPGDTLDLEALLPGAVRVPLQGDPAAFRQALGRAVQAHESRGRGPLFVAIVEADGNHYAEAGRALASLGVVHAFFLEGGLDAFRRFQSDERARLARSQVIGGSACEQP
jgi:rhodanese-related sulfurtransferase